MLGLIANSLRILRRHGASGIERFERRFRQQLQAVTRALEIATFVSALAFAVCMVVYVGFDHSKWEYTLLHRVLRAAQIVFSTNVLFRLLFHGKYTFRHGRAFGYTLSIAVLSTLVPWLCHPSNTWIPFLQDIIYSRWYVFGILTIYTVMELSFGVMAILGSHTNPSLILSGSFVLFILIGTLMLMMPNCTYGGIGFIDALFVSTSAVCITGLTPIDISATLTPFGLIVLGLLLQTGALGVMTFTSFFALFFSGTSSIYSQLLLSDVIYSKSMSELIPTLLYVLGLTLAVEAIGAVCIFFSIHGTLSMSPDQEIMFAIFHSISAFCNAGFSNMPDGLSNPALLYGSQSFYWVMSLLIVAGAIGFPILVNFKDVIRTYLKRTWHIVTCRNRGASELHIYSMNTKVVLTTFGILFVSGAVTFYLLECDNTLAGMTEWEKITQSVFNAVTPRSAGFSSVNPARFLNSTLVIVMFLMWIGGASQSTAGGIKVNTFATLVLSLRSSILGRSRVEVFGRNISSGSIRRANSVVALSVLSYAAYSIVLLILEPELPARSLLFESLSALFTVGSSLGATSALGADSKVILCTAMFLGRVGMLSLLTGIAGRRHDTTTRFPDGNIIIS